MKTSIVSALHSIANGFADSYSSALSGIRGFTGTAQDSDFVTPMVNVAVSADVVKATAAAVKISSELEKSALDIIA